MEYLPKVILKENPVIFRQTALDVECRLLGLCLFS